MLMKTKYLVINCLGKYYDCNAILRTVSSVLDINIDAIKGKSHKSELVAARQIYCHLCKEFNNSGLLKTGKLINRTHGNTHYSIATANNRLLFDRYFKSIYTEVLNHLKKEDYGSIFEHNSLTGNYKVQASEG